MYRTIKRLLKQGPIRLTQQKLAPIGQGFIGRDDTGVDVIEWATRGESLGAGEILLTSMDTDGVQEGFDCELTRSVSRATRVPVIASGGAGKPEHFSRVLTEGEADAALAASIFHYGTYTVADLKNHLARCGTPVRRSS